MLTHEKYSSGVVVIRLNNKNVLRYYVINNVYIIETHYGDTQRYNNWQECKQSIIENIEYFKIRGG